MTKTEAMRQTRQENVLIELGFTMTETAQLRRISMTLRRWHELECGDGHNYIERDEKTGQTYYVNCNSRYLSANDPRARSATPDRETGAKKRLDAILAARNSRYGHAPDHANWKCDNGTFDTVSDDGVIKQNLAAKDAIMSAYIQGDPRGAALYILRPGDVPAGQPVDSYYSRGICVY
tara:strand:+ start:1744 stop:2277 length:534 start_codon:yes stop_codon:yes gene_type:complete